MDSLPARFISMGVWVTGVRDAWEDFDVVVNNIALLNPSHGSIRIPVIALLNPSHGNIQPRSWHY